MPKHNTPYLVERKNGFYWQPTKAFKEQAEQVLGFGFRALGKDMDQAIETARSYNKAVKEAQAGQQKEHFLPGTFAHLAAVYRGDTDKGIKPTQDWFELSERSKVDYGMYIDLLVEKWGKYRVEAIDSEVVEALRDSMRATPYKGNYVLRVLSKMMSVAIRKKSIFNVTTNPCKHIKKFGVKAGVKPRRQYWTPEDEEKFLKLAWNKDPEIAMAYTLLVFTGQRVGDTRGMTAKDYDGEKIKVSQDKTDVKLWIPVHQDLKIVLDAHIKLRAEKGRIGGTLLQTVNGQPFKKRYFNERWNKIARAVNINKTLQPRDLRRTAVTRLYEAGCTMRQVASISGHTEKSVEKIIETYTVTTYPMAQEAIRLYEKHTAKNRRETK